MNKRTCSQCKADKPVEDFFLRDKTTGRRHAECKACYTERRRIYYTEHYRKYGDQYRQRAKIRREKIKDELQRYLLEYLSNKCCAKCGETDPVVLEFDHINPSEKSFGIARAISDGLAWQKILAEINKCQVLCANCHKKKTAREFGWYQRVNIISSGGADRI